VLDRDLNVATKVANLASLAKLAGELPASQNACGVASSGCECELQCN
jgi:hypothetical protein